ELATTDVKALEDPRVEQAVRPGQRADDDFRDDLVELPRRRDRHAAGAGVAERVPEAAAELAAPVQVVLRRQRPDRRLEWNRAAVLRVELRELVRRQVPSRVRA